MSFETSDVSDEELLDAVNAIESNRSKLLCRCVSLCELVERACSRKISNYFVAIVSALQ